jgi:hypothetical protein
MLVGVWQALNVLRSQHASRGNAFTTTQSDQTCNWTRSLAARTLEHPT